MLSINNLYCGYNGNDVVKDINFSLKSNEKICIIGPNGCGKTTLLRAISGLLDYKGKVILNDKDILRMKRKEIAKSMALLTQMSSVYFSYTIYETVALGRYLINSKNILSEETQDDKDKILNCLETVGLTDIKDKPITELSGGQLQRVFLARVFAQEPEVILLDEPTNHLDLKHQLELIEYLNKWVENENHSLVAVMHDLNLAFQLADKIVLMNNGEVVEIGTPEKILLNNNLNFVYDIDVKSYMQKSFLTWK